MEMEMERVRTLLRTIERHRESFEVASELLRDINNARGGGILTGLLVGFASLGRISKFVNPAKHPWQALQEAGLHYKWLFLDDALKKELVLRTKPDLLAESNEERAYVWRREDRKAVLGVYNIGEAYDLFFGEGGDAFLESKLSFLWKGEQGLMLSTSQDKKLTTLPLPAPGKFVGKVGPGFYVERLRRYGPGPRAILIRGPSGVGKSCLARHIAIGLGKGNARTLKVSSEVLKNLGDGVSVLSLVRWLRPTVLLLDDLDLSDREKTQTFLALLEALRDPNCLVIATMMLSPSEVKKTPKPGGLYFPGIRPGRIDEIFTLGLPDQDDRLLIMREACTDLGVEFPEEFLQTLARATEDLTGAYLANLVERVARHGVAKWEEELASLRLMSPDFAKDEKKEGEAKLDAPSVPPKEA